jgi:hypothetical protein
MNVAQRSVSSGKRSVIGRYPCVIVPGACRRKACPVSPKSAIRNRMAVLRRQASLFGFEWRWRQGATAADRHRSGRRVSVLGWVGGIGGQQGQWHALAA